jgi:hypothetical protein
VESDPGNECPRAYQRGVPPTDEHSVQPTSNAVVFLLFGLLRSGAVNLRTIDGWKDMPQSLRKAA